MGSRIGVASAGALFLALAAVQWRFTLDDAWIIARYADNLAAGYGWSFNPGEPIEGTTTVLWTLLGWLGAALGLHGVVLLKAAGVACGLAAVVFVARRGPAPAGPERGLAALALAAYVPHSLWSAAGLETAAAGWLGAAGAWLALSREPARARAGACLLALGFLARPDAAIFWGAVPAVGALRWLLEGARPGRALLEPLAILIATAVLTTAWRYWSFGALAPNTAVTKGAEPLASALAAGLPLLWRWLQYQAFGVLVLLAVLGSARRDPERLALLAVLAVSLGYLVCLGIPDQSLVYRFYAPLAPLVALLAADGAASLGEGLGRRGRTAVRAALLLPLAFLPSAFRAVWHEPEPWFHSPYSLSQRVVGMRAAIAFAREIDALLPPDASMAISDAGAIPYFAPRRVVDLFGLNDREIARAIAGIRAARSSEERERKARAYADVVHRREPDCFVNTWIAPVISQDPRWEACYRKAVLPHTYWFNEEAGAEIALYLRACD